MRTGRGVFAVSALLLAGLLARGAEAAAQESALEVLVVERGEGGKPVEGARIHIPGTTVQAVTDATGHALMPGVPARSLTVQISRVGYQNAVVTVAFEADRTMQLRVPLAPRPVELEGVEVTGELRAREIARLNRAGFYGRRNLGLGSFIDPIAVDQRRKMGGRMSDLLRGTPGVELRPHVGPGFAAYSTRHRGSTSMACPMAVFVDGVKQPPEPLPGQLSERRSNAALQAPDPALQSRMQATNVDRLLPLMDVEAVEVYSGKADTPLEFHVPPGCGAIVIWTRSGGR